TATQPGEELRFGVTPSQLRIESGADLEAKLRVRGGKLIWFGKPVTWPFEVEPALTGERVLDGTQRQNLLNGEFVQLSVLPRWLLALLGVLLALLIAWFALVRPAVQSAAQQAVEHKVKQIAASSQRPGGGGNAGTSAGGQQTGGQGNQGTGGGASGGGASGSGGAAGTRQQSSTTINVRTNKGGHSVGSYSVPTGKLFLITDIVVANFQGDEGVMTINFGARTITTIALETFRNQDYHWVTPIEVPANARVTADVNCTKPGTPASGRQAAACTELLNVSGELRDTKR
ncbi:MAG: hydrolytic protein, partial [Sciscionella sp.]